MVIQHLLLGSSDRLAASRQTVSPAGQFVLCPWAHSCGDNFAIQEVYRLAYQQAKLAIEAAEARRQWRSVQIAN